MKQVRYHMSRKVSDGDFGNTEIGVDITDEVAEGEKFSDAAKRVKTMVETLLNAELAENGLA